MKINLKKGDIILTGKWQNKKVKVKTMGKNELGQYTINGKPALKFRIKKLLPKSMRKDEGLEFKTFESFSEQLIEAKSAPQDAYMKHMFLTGDTDGHFRGDLSDNPNYKKRNSPPKELERRLKVENISTEWKNPFVYPGDENNNLTFEEIENLNLIFENDKEVILFIFKKMIESNPELKTFEDRRVDELRTVIGGVCSSMNADDIKDYLDNSTKIIGDTKPYKIDRKSKDDPEYAKLFNIITERVISHNTASNKILLMGWFPSTKTLESIIKQMK